MAEESTRKLLKVFGMAVTDFEDRCLHIVQQAREAAQQRDDLEAFLPLFEDLVRSGSEVGKQLMEVTRLVIERQTRTHSELLGLLEDLKKRKGSPA
jgi:hypothetical protein